MSEKHTPGPYEVVDADIPGIYLIWAANIPPQFDGHIAEVHGPNAEANAILFASAPDMAETIERQSAVILNLRTNVDCQAERIRDLDIEREKLQESAQSYTFTQQDIIAQAKQIEQLEEAMATTAGDISEAVKDIDDMEAIEARQRLIDTHKRLCAETEVEK